MIDVISLALSKNYTDKEITKAATSLSFKQKIVESLPSSGEIHTIYFIKNNSSWKDNYYDEYLWISSTNSFEKIGSTEINSNFLLPSYSEDDSGKSLVIGSENKKPEWTEQSYIDYSKAQELTDEQKAQARDNIGIPANGVLVVEISDNNGTLTANKTYAEIKEAFLNGTTIYLYDGSYRYPLINIDDEFNFWFGIIQVESGGPYIKCEYFIIYYNSSIVSRYYDEINSFPNPNALTIKVGGTTITYDGSEAKTIEIEDGGEVAY